jgi:hypothetical protein
VGPQARTGVQVTISVPAGKSMVDPGCGKWWDARHIPATVLHPPSPFPRCPCSPLREAANKEDRAACPPVVALLPGSSAHTRNDACSSSGRSCIISRPIAHDRSGGFPGARGDGSRNAASGICNFGSAVCGKWGAAHRRGAVSRE